MSSSNRKSKIEKLTGGFALTPQLRNGQTGCGGALLGMAVTARDASPLTTPSPSDRQAQIS